MTLLLTLDDGSVQRKLADAVEFARAAVLKDAPEEQIGTHVGASREDAVTASHLFEAQVPGYRGWRWSVTIALVGDDEPVTISEVVLLPGPEARIAPAWVPWERRVRAGDLGVGDIFPTDDDDPRLVPAYLQSDDPAVEAVAQDAGLGRIHVLSRFGRTDAAARWHSGEFGPRSDMARSAPDVCGTCGFFVPLAGSLRGVFGACSNDIAPADGHVVDVEYGCGAHSEVEVEVMSSVPVAELVYDDSLLDYTPDPEVVETAAAEPETAIAEADVSPAEVEPEASQAEVSSPVAEPAEAVVTDAVAEPVVASELADSEPTQAEVTDAVAEPVAAEAEQAPVEVTDVVAEPVAVEEEQAQAQVTDVVAEPTQAEMTEVVAEPQEAVATDVVAELAATEVPEPVDAEPTQVEVTDAVAAEVPEPTVAEPQVEVTEPVVAEVPEPADAEPTQAEVTDAVAEPQTASESPEVVTETQAPGTPAEADAAEVHPVSPEALGEAGRLSAAGVAEPIQAQSAAEPAEAEAAEADPVPAEAGGEAAATVSEPAQAEVTDVVGERLVEVTEQEIEVPEAALTDSVVTAAGEPVAGEPADAVQAATVEPVAPEAEATQVEAGEAHTDTEATGDQRND